MIPEERAGTSELALYDSAWVLRRAEKFFERHSSIRSFLLVHEHHSTQKHRTSVSWTIAHTFAYVSTSLKSFVRNRVFSLRTTQNETPNSREIKSVPRLPTTRPTISRLTASGTGILKANRKLKANQANRNRNRILILTLGTISNRNRNPGTVWPVSWAGTVAGRSWTPSWWARCSGSSGYYTYLSSPYYSTIV